MKFKQQNYEVKMVQKKGVRGRKAKSVSDKKKVIKNRIIHKLKKRTPKTLHEVLTEIPRPENMVTKKDLVAAEKEIERFTREEVKKAEIKIDSELSKTVAKVSAEAKTHRHLFWRYTAVIYIIISVLLLVAIVFTFGMVTSDKITVTYLKTPDCGNCDVDWLKSDIDASSTFKFAQYSADIRVPLVMIPKNGRMLIYAADQKQEIIAELCRINPDEKFC